MVIICTVDDEDEEMPSESNESNEQSSQMLNDQPEEQLSSGYPEQSSPSSVNVISHCHLPLVNQLSLFAMSLPSLIMIQSTHYFMIISNLLQFCHIEPLEALIVSSMFIG